MNNRENSKRPRGRPRKRDHAIKAIQLLAAHGYSDAAIRRWFEEQMGQEEVILPDGERVSPWYETVPDWSTVRKYAERFRPLDPSGWWEPATAEPEQVRAVLPIATAVYAATAGRAWLTNDLAALIERFVSAEPGIPPFAAYILAIQMRHALDAKEQEIQRLILTAIAMRAWRAEGEAALDRLLDQLPDGDRLRQWRRINLPGDITVWAHPAMIGNVAVPKPGVPGASTVIAPTFTFWSFEQGREAKHDSE